MSHEACNSVVSFFTMCVIFFSNAVFAFVTYVLAFSSAEDVIDVTTPMKECKLSSTSSTLVALLI